MVSAKRRLMKIFIPSGGAESEVEGCGLDAPGEFEGVCVCVLCSVKGRFAAMRSSRTGGSAKTPADPTKRSASSRETISVGSENPTVVRVRQTFAAACPRFAGKSKEREGTRLGELHEERMTALARAATKQATAPCERNNRSEGNGKQQRQEQLGMKPVSYTHLTLPTILLV